MLHEFWQNALATLGYILVFLGIQPYLGPVIQKYPWALIITGILLAMQARNISNKIGQ
jgi:hypothetical protein